MWPFKKRLPEIWEFFPSRPEDTEGFMPQAQRDFIFWALETSPYVTRKDLKAVYRTYNGCVDAGNQKMADHYLSFCPSLNGTNLRRISEPAYWEEYQRIFYGRRIDKLEYVISGKVVPIRDKGVWRTNQSFQDWIQQRGPTRTVEGES